MSNRRLAGAWVSVVVVLGLVAAFRQPALADQPPPDLIVPYVPSAPEVVAEMLKLTKVGPDDIVYDLGCGDGRIVVAAVKDFKAKKGVGIDLNPVRIKEAKENVEKNGVGDRVVIKLGDLREADVKEASVVTLFLLTRVNLMVRPILFRDLKPGCRVVSHAFTMGEWEQDQLVRNDRALSGVVYFWTIPAHVGGTWTWSLKGKDADIPCSLAISQEFQRFVGHLTLPGEKPVRVDNTALSGKDISFAAAVKVDGQPVKIAWRGTVEGDAVAGTQEIEGGPNPGKQPWAAKRQPVDLCGTWPVKVNPPAPDLDGTLTIERKDGTLAATYSLAKDNKAVPVTALYDWGGSLRFEIPLDISTVAFKGTLGAQGLAGTVRSEGSDKDIPWSAEKK